MPKSSKSKSTGRKIRGNVNKTTYLNDTNTGIQRYLNWSVLAYGSMIAFFLSLIASAFVTRFQCLIEKMNIYFFFILILIFLLVVRRLFIEIRNILSVPTPKPSKSKTFAFTLNVLINFYKKHKDAVISYEFEKGKFIDFGILVFIFLAIMLTALYLIFIRFGTIQPERDYIELLILIIIFLLCASLLIISIIKSNELKMFVASWWPCKITFDLKESIISMPLDYSIVFDTKKKEYYFVRLELEEPENWQKLIEENIADRENEIVESEKTPIADKVVVLCLFIQLRILAPMQQFFRKLFQKEKSI